MPTASLPAPPSSEHAPDPGSLWALCLEKLGQELPEQQFNTWIRPLHVSLSDDGSRLVNYTLALSLVEDGPCPLPDPAVEAP